jgi:PPP family 3-phenylpropionic acid transporter
VWGSITYVIVLIILQSGIFMRPDNSFNISFWIMLTSVLSIVCIMIVPASYFIVPQPEKKEPEDAARTTDAVRRGGEKSFWTPYFILGFLMIFFNKLALSPIQNFLSLYVLEELKSNSVGLVSAISASAEVPFIFFSSRILKKISPIALLALGSVAVIVRLLLYIIFPSLGGVIAGQLLHSLTYGTFHPAAVAFISSCVPPKKRALGMSLYVALGIGLPTLLGNFAGGFIIEAAGFHTLFGSFTVFGIIGVILYLVAKFAPRHTNNHE